MVELLERLRQTLSDRYQVDRVLGHGGMAIVFLALDLKHQRQVAIKVLRPELALALGPDRFLREIAIAARLTHPNILPLHDSGEADGLLYYVMPYVAGESLRDLLDREGRLDPRTAVRITREVADALQFAHEAGLVHRDIKPENILFQADHALVSDFGIARAVSSAGSKRLTETGLAVGTPAYMSPEQALGATDLDARSDVYSLGCLLYEMLSGHTPFRGPTPQAIVAGHAAGAVPPLSSLGVSVPAGIELAIRAALAKDPDARVPTAREFASQLGADPPLAASLRRRLAGTRRQILAVAAVVLALAGWWGWRRFATPAAPTLRSLAVLPLTDLSGDSGQAWLSVGIHEALIDELSRIGGLRVIPRRSTLAYQDSRKGVPEIARELGVDGVVDGSVRRTGDSLGLEIQLIQARPEERQLWAGEFRRDMGHVLSVYGDVARAVAGQVQVSLTSADSVRLAGARVVDPVAYEAYLRGRFNWYTLSREGIDAAERQFELALQRDPADPLAHAGLSSVWISRLQMGLAPPDVAVPRAKAEARNALALDSTLVEGHHNLGLIAIQTDWDWELAEAEMRRTIALNPGFPEARAFYSHLLNILGRPGEARKQMDRALALDPLNPLFLALDAVDLLFERKWEAAVAQALTALRTAPAQPVALYALWLAHHSQGDQDSAAMAATEYLAAVAQPRAAEVILPVLREHGYAAAMRRAGDLLATGSAAGYAAPGDIATLYLAAGERRLGLEWLERGYAARDPNTPYVGLPLMRDQLRREPGYESLVRRMRLPS